MKVDYIKTIGFRKFKGVFETKLFDTTNITGKIVLEKQYTICNCKYNVRN